MGFVQILVQIQEFAVATLEKIKSAEIIHLSDVCGKFLYLKKIPYFNQKIIFIFSPLLINGQNHAHG